MSAIWGLAKSVARKVWFREGAVRRCFLGPYAGLAFEMSPQLLGSRMVVYYSAYEPEVTSLLSQVVHPGMVVFNVGAHLGIHALYMAKLLKNQGAVYAFEPCPENFLLLQRNVKNNQLFGQRIFAVRQAVGASDGPAGLTIGDTDGTHHLTRLGEAATLEVEVTTLDRFCSMTHQRADLILVDIEGEELSLLNGSEDLIRSCKPRFILEHHGTAARTQITNWLTSRNYSIRSIGTRHIYAE